MDASLKIVVKHDPKRQRISDLSGQATLHKDRKEWDAAIACLREAEKLMVEGGTSYPILAYLRLPLFLQQAGQFDQAMKEFERLLADVEPRIDREFSHASGKTRTMLMHAERSTIYEKMALVCKRQKLSELESKYRKLADDHRRAHAKLISKTL